MTLLVLNFTKIKSFYGDFIFYFLIFALIYAGALFVPYALSDDYSLLYKAMGHEWFGYFFKAVIRESFNQFIFYERGELGVAITNARPLMGGYIYVVFKHFIHSIEALVWLRLFSVAGLAAFAALLSTWLKRYQWPLSLAFGVPVLIACSPPFIIYVVWAICSLFPWAALLAGLSYICLEKWRSNPQKPQWVLASMGLFVAALGIYQPVAMMFWVFAAVRWLSFERFDKAFVQSLLMDIIVAFLAMALAYLAFVKGLPYLLDIMPSPRGALVTQPFQKLWWFIKEPLLMSAHSWLILKPTPWLGMLLLLFIGLGLWGKQPNMRNTLIKSVLGVVLILASALPSLIVALNDTSYRQYAALTALILLGLGHGLSVIQGNSKSFPVFCRIFPAEQVVMSCLIIWSVFMGSYRALHYFVIPQVREKELVASAIRKVHDQNPQELYLKGSMHTLVKQPVLEFGMTLTASGDPWHVFTMVGVLWQEQYPGEPMPFLHLDPMFMKVVSWQALSPNYARIDIQPLPEQALPNSAILDLDNVLGSAEKQ